MEAAEDLTREHKKGNFLKNWKSGEHCISPVLGCRYICGGRLRLSQPCPAVGLNASSCSHAALDVNPAPERKLILVTPKNSIQILLVDDQPSVRNGIRSLLGSRPEWNICGEASDGLEGIEKARALRPDLVLMDISMPRMNGLDAARIVRKELPNSKVVIVSQNDPSVVLIQAREVNASAHVAKQELFGTLLPVLDALMGSKQSDARESSPTKPVPSSIPDWLAGGGELGQMIGRFDWAKTPLGAIEQWPQSLKTSINLMLSSQHPMWIGWGPHATFLYNDAYIQVLSNAKHPWALGKPAAEVWAEIWDICGRTLADNISQFAWMANSSGWVYWFNRRWFEYTGTSPEEMQGWGWQKVLHPDDVARVTEKLKNSFAHGDVWEDTFQLRGKGGEYRWFLSRAVPIKNAHGKITRWFGTNTDITELRSAQDALRESKEFTEEQVRARTRELELRNAEIIQQSEQLRELSHKMLQIQDDERRHVARELHDSAGQILTALGLNLAQVARVARQNAPKLIEGLNETQQFVNQLSKEIRTMSYLLHPPLLDESGLPVALRWYAEGLAERSGLKINVNIPENLGRFGRDMELMMFRLVQECLTNIHRHSGGNHADITVWSDGCEVGLDIRDNGKGMSAEKLAHIQAQGGGVGIRGMRERIHPFQGTMEIESDGSGTQISFRLPIHLVASATDDEAPRVQIPA